MNIDDYIEERNEIGLLAEPGNAGNKIPDQKEAEAFAQRIWMELGVANRHIERVLKGTMSLSAVEGEIQSCLKRVRKMVTV